MNGGDPETRFLMRKWVLAVALLTLLLRSGLPTTVA